MTRERMERDDGDPWVRSAEEAAQKYLQPGEELQLVLPARVGGAILQYVTFAAFVPALGDIFQKQFFLYLTDRRMLLVATKGLKEKPGELEKDFLRSDLQVVRVKEGRHWFSLPTLVLKARGEILPFNFDPPCRTQVGQLANALARS